MLEWLSGLHRFNARQWYGSTVTIEEETAPDVWTVIEADVPCQVQQPRSSSSSREEDVATTEEMEGIVVYMDPEVAVSPGNRVIWQGEPWDVNSVSGDRTAPYAQRLDCTRPQTALTPELITFRRRLDGAWVEVGTFPMRFTRTAPSVPLPSGENTADGAFIQSTMIGDASSAVVQVGDWFGRGGMPGRVLDRDDTHEDHIEFLYQLEVRVP